MVQEKTERRWEVTVLGNERDSPIQVVVNSVDGDPKHVKLSVLGHASVVVSVEDMIDLLKRVAANTSGIPHGL